LNYNNVSASEEDDNGLKKVCMGSHRIGELGLSESGPSSHHIPYGVLNGINTPVSSLMYSSISSSFDFSGIAKFLRNIFMVIHCSIHFTDMIGLFSFKLLFCFVLFLSNQGSAFDFGELEEAIVLHGVKGRNDDGKACMFPFSSLVLFF